MFRSLSIIFSIIVFVLPAFADPEASALAKMVNDREANEGRVGSMHFQLVNKSGKKRDRTAVMVHSETIDVERIGIYFTKPAMIADTSFMSHDYRASDDSNWLYLPATDRVRRLPMSDRGDYFMGTDLTYGDIKDNFKFAADDWSFGVDGYESLNGKSYPVLTGRIQSSKIADQTGYSAFRALIDTETAFPIQIDYKDEDGDDLKTVNVRKLDQIAGAWTAMEFSVQNLQTGHATKIHFTEMRHVTNIDDYIFDPDALVDGVPDIG